MIGLELFAQNEKLDSLHNKAEEYNLKGSYAELFLTYDALRNEYVNLKDTNEIVSTILNMADASRGGGSHSEALKVLDNLESSDYHLTVLDQIEMDLIRGSIHYELHHRDKAIHWAQEGLRLSLQENEQGNLALLYNLLGACYVEVDTDSALKYLDASVEMFLMEEDSAGVILPRINMARLYMERGEQEMAVKMLLSSLEILDQYEVAIYRKMAYDFLAILYIEMKDYENGIKYMKLRDSVNYMINNSQIKFRITQFQDELERQRAESDLMTLQAKVEIAEVKNNRDSIIITLGLVLVVVLGMFLFFTVRNNKRIRVLNTELKQKADELERLNGFKNRVLSVISHDMRSPLAQVITFQQAKNSGVSFDEEEIAEMDKTILASVQNGLLILDNLLKWANSQFNGMSIDLVSFDSFHSISVILNQVSQLAKEKHLSLTTYADHIDVETDEALFQIVIRNIVSNAIKFSPLGSEIEVRTELLDGFFKVKIRDQGSGISQSVLDSLEIGKDIKAELGSLGEKGAGIGLTLSIEFAKLIRGTLAFKNLEGKGTEVVFTIPQKLKDS